MSQYKVHILTCAYFDVDENPSTVVLRAFTSKAKATRFLKKIEEEMKISDDIILELYNEYTLIMPSSRIYSIALSAMEKKCKNILELHYSTLNMEKIKNGLLEIHSTLLF